MSKPLNDKEVLRYVEAFADGELDVEQNLRVLEHIQFNPAATRRVVHQQQLREAVEQTLRRHTPPTPQTLRERIAAMAADLPTPAGALSTQARRAPEVGVITRLGFWIPASISVVLLVILLSLPHVPADTQAPSGHLSISRINALSKRHVVCTQRLEPLRDVAEFPRRIDDVPAAAAAYLGVQPYAVLDLASLGYQYEGAGKCSVPGDRAVHLIYQARGDTGRSDSLSLWIIPDQGRFNVKPDHIFAATTPSAAHPVVFWRHAGAIYYVVGDSDTAVQRAAEYLFGE